jgi:alanine racemase
VIHNLEQVEMLEKLRFESALQVYLKVNSGMNRLGFTVDNVRLAWNALEAHAGVESITLMTHFADADGEGGVAAQLQWFRELTQPFQAPCSLANSAALLRYPEEVRADWVRPGIMLYGCSPFGFKSAAEIGLEPVMTLGSEIIAVQRLQAGEWIGYGQTYQAAQEMTIGVIACGYADGYPRHAPSGTPVLVAGERTRTVGRVSMDMLCVDISDIPGAHAGSPATLWGEGLPCDEVAASAGTVSYELLCALAPRVPVLEV